MNSIFTKFFRRIFISIIITIVYIPESFSFEDTNSPLTIYAIDLAYRLSENGETQYNALLQAFEDEGLYFKTLVRPLRRSLLNFQRNKTSCIFPATIGAITANDASYSKKKLLASHPIDRASLRVFTQPQKTVINDISELNGKKIAVINGLNPEVFFSNIQVSLEYTSSEEARIKMLNANRIDAVLGFLPDVLIAAEALGMTEPSYSSKLSVLSDGGVGLICHDTKSADDFIKRINQTINKLKKNGKLREILGPYADIVPVKD